MIFVDGKGQKDKFSVVFLISILSLLFVTPKARGEERDTLSKMIGRENPII